MQRSDLSLKWLEVFRETAHLGSVQAVANETGLSISTVSHHLRSLEDQLGVSLLNHKKRPMTLTPSGLVFLKNVDQALKLIGKARAEVTLGSMADAQNLRLGLIEDFDSDIGPSLAVFLAAGMPRCDFAHHTRDSRDILAMLRLKKLDIGVANLPNDGLGDLIDFPMIRDPFVLALPAHTSTDPEDFLAGKSDLPLLRYVKTQQISQQVDTQLRRLKLDLPSRFEIESNQTMMAMIASGAGWSVTTPTCYFRARRFHGQVTLHPLPIKSFARYISLLATPECPGQVTAMINATMRDLVEKRLLDPAYEAMPWLKESFHLLAVDH
ncbi:MAG: LysR family transcriptional regulator [Paracoccaceae bacterium]|nr:LysR family transcriptional regulator [Paracoccaceae bacterium]